MTWPVKILKIWTSENIAVIILKFEHLVLLTCPEVATGTANSVDPDQTQVKLGLQTV